MASSTTPIRRTSVELTPYGACTRGSTARHSVATRPAYGGAATTSTRASEYSGRAPALDRRFLDERGDPCLVGGGQLLWQGKGDWPHRALVQARRITEAE